ncbi:hypothetical protein BDV29DRAFT_162287 [Aspergillus leporis]|jgi:hypothetical protein|uniref:Calcineurin-like phosphoesterase domain-containing protein n=1 Tax=Aspergillus leporis TaxID=41062 RepID=A0A5N5WIZ8_9EURO|nr:hypothetical protein BDV29DRAFT_162287 [Aspergillus leporis]
MACFQILSDLHLESPKAYGLFDIPPQAPYLALLGDIGNAKDHGLFTFLEAQLHKIRVVLYLLGNHEPHHSSRATAREKIQDFSDTINQKRAHEDRQMRQFVFMDQTRYDITADVTVLGCTLYSRLSKEQEMRVSFGLNDFYHIDDWTVEAHCNAHEADRT